METIMQTAPIAPAAPVTVTDRGAIPETAATQGASPDTDLIRRTVLITGATSGIGLAAAEELAARGWQVLAVGRSVESGRQADAEIRRSCPEARIAWFAADLSSQQAVNGLADAVERWLVGQSSRLDVLLNNAATVRSWYMATADGYEMQFAVNHLAAFLLTRLLLPRLAESPIARVLTVSSGSHRGARIRWNDIMNRRRYNCLRAYSQSKLCNVLFTRAFNRRMAGAAQPVRAFAVDPGLVRTDIGRKWTGGLIARFWRRRSSHGLAPEQAASTIAWLCKQPADWQAEGDYYHNCQPEAVSRAAMDEGSASRLWDLSLMLCGLPGSSVQTAIREGA